MSSSRGDASFFVGREQLLTRVVRDLEPGQALRADDVTGAVGMGKSTLLRRIKDLAGESSYDIALLDLTLYEPGYAGRSRAELTHVDALRNFDALKAMARAVVQQLRPDLVERITDDAKQAWVPVLDVQAHHVTVENTMNVGDNAVVSGSGQTATSSGVDFDADYEAARVQRILSAGLALSEALIACLNEISRTRPILLLVDNVDRVTDTEVGGWLLRVVQQLERAVVVLTHEPGREAELPAGIGERVRIPPLTVDEVRLYLERRQVEADDPELAALVHRSSGGIPLAVTILVKLLADKATGLSADHLRGRLDMASSDPRDRIAEVVASMVERLEGDVVGDALRAVSVTDDCDATLLAQLLEAMGHSDFKLRQVMKDLEAFSFTDEFSDDNGHHVRVHPFIAKGIVESLARHDEGDLLTRLHRVAAAYYFGKITDRSDYGDMFLYQQPATQSLLRKWLRQLAHARDRSTYQEAALVYLDAFWWWGNYVHFDFCDVLVQDLADLAAESKNTKLAEFADALRRFGRHYPYRAQHRRKFDDRHRSGDWEQVRDALYEILDHCRLLKGPPVGRPGSADAQEPTTARQVAGLVDIFLAHSHRYEGTTEQALEHYDEAATLLEGLRDNWDYAWVAFERADTLYEAGRTDEALHGATRAATIHAAIDDDTDDELVANLHRLRGDCLWSTGEHQEAMSEYASAVMHSYLFHGAGGDRDDDGGDRDDAAVDREEVGGHPDDYTMQFYYEIRGRTLERLLALRDLGDRAALVDGIKAMAGPLPPTSRWPRPDADQLVDELGRLSVPELADRLFPRGPKLHELGQRRSAFMTEMRPLVPLLHRMLADDLPLDPTSSDGSPSPP